MIYDRLENISFYCKEHERLYKAVKYALEFDLSLPDGDYEIDKRDVYASIQTYITSPAEKKLFECHKEYFDVQVVRLGMERHDIANDEGVDVHEEYDPDRDVKFFKFSDKYSTITMVPGFFSVYYPQDIHKPGCNIGEKSEKVRKICMKVRI